MGKHLDRKVSNIAEQVARVVMAATVPVVVVKSLCSNVDRGNVPTGGILADFSITRMRGIIHYRASVTVYKDPHLILGKDARGSILAMHYIAIELETNVGRSIVVSSAAIIFGRDDGRSRMVVSIYRSVVSLAATAT